MTQLLAQARQGLGDQISEYTRVTPLFTRGRDVQYDDKVKTFIDDDVCIDKFKFNFTELDVARLHIYHTKKGRIAAKTVAFNVRPDSYKVLDTAGHARYLFEKHSFGYSKEIVTGVDVRGSGRFYDVFKNTPLILPSNNRSMLNFAYLRKQLDGMYRHDESDRFSASHAVNDLTMPFRFLSSSALGLMEHIHRNYFGGISVTTGDPEAVGEAVTSLLNYSTACERGRERVHMITFTANMDYYRSYHNYCDISINNAFENEGSSAEEKMVTIVFRTNHRIFSEDIIILRVPRELYIRFNKFVPNIGGNSTQLNEYMKLNLLCALGWLESCYLSSFEEAEYSKKRYSIGLTLPSILGPMARPGSELLLPGFNRSTIIACQRLRDVTLYNTDTSDPSSKVPYPYVHHWFCSGHDTLHELYWGGILESWNLKKLAVYPLHDGECRVSYTRRYVDSLGEKLGRPLDRTIELDGRTGLAWFGKTGVKNKSKSK